MSFYLFVLSMAIISAFIPLCFTVIWRPPAAALTLPSSVFTWRAQLCILCSTTYSKYKVLFKPPNDVSYNGDESVDCIMMQSWKKEPNTTSNEWKKCFKSATRCIFKQKLRGRKRKVVSFHHNVVFMCKNANISSCPSELRCILFGPGKNASIPN